jgi:hypothetical protein
VQLTFLTTKEENKMNFEEFQQKAIAGELATCYVTYEALAVDANGGQLDAVTVTGERDELTDFDSAVTDEACQPIADNLEVHLSEKYNTDAKVIALTVKHILVKVDNVDMSTRFIAFMADGRTLTLDISAHENFEALLSSLLEV